MLEAQKRVEPSYSHLPSESLYDPLNFCSFIHLVTSSDSWVGGEDLVEIGVCGTFIDLRLVGYVHTYSKIRDFILDLREGSTGSKISKDRRRTMKNSDSSQKQTQHK